MALNVLFRQLSPDRSDNFLDLGAAFGANVDFFHNTPAGYLHRRLLPNT